jgi:hypothetical protein
MRLRCSVLLTRYNWNRSEDVEGDHEQWGARHAFTRLDHGTEQDTIAFLPSSQVTNSERQIHVEALRAGTPKSRVVRKNNVAALFANLAPIGENLHRPEPRTQNTIGAARLFLVLH